MPTPVIPETIIVHLGAPDEAAQNISISFPDYIKNVASSGQVGYISLEATFLI